MEKKKHVIRNIVISVVAAFGIVLAATGISICDFTDNTPEYTSEVKGVSTGDYIGNLADESFKNCGLLDDYEFLLDEHKINNLLATVVEVIDIPCVNIKSIYLNIDENDNIQAEAPLWALFYKCCAKAKGFLTYDDESLVLELSEIKLNLLSSRRGIVEQIVTEKMVEDIEDSLEESGVHIDMWKEGKNLYAKMTILDICRTIADCSKNATGFITAALVGGALTTRTVDLVVNENGLTGIVIHRRLINL